MSDIILPGSDDLMVQKAHQAAQRDQAAFAMAKQIEMSVMITAFTQCAMAHAASGKELNLESGRAMAVESQALSQQYCGFILEVLGLATMTKKESSAEVLDQDQVDKMFDKS